jgi:hypothetical protein
MSPVGRHIAAPDKCDGTSAVGESRHRIPGASVGQPTEPWLAISDRRVCLPCSSSPPIAGGDRRAAPAPQEEERRSGPSRGLRANCAATGKYSLLLGSAVLPPMTNRTATDGGDEQMFGAE